MKIIREIASWVIPVIIGLLIALGIKDYVFAMVRVDGPSMTPNLKNDERVLVVKPLSVNRMGVIVFDAYGEDPDAAPGTDYVKRVIGLPGDTVASKDGQLYVNQKRVSQSYISESERTKGTGNWTLSSLAKTNEWPRSEQVARVPKGKVFVLGDHRSVSNDSRYWGYVSQDKIIGVVKVPFWISTKSARDNINDFK
ncbi:signal peptidase I [Levilactobacillus bambusae]|uniref:Signal peptidase I n=1 Tax=Levilactobacillus bambusae TaxID=2024736 RepID=A0A2V1N2Y4_9LACO|nr:signal peptidase I [Levilactobacillus bambusae]PWG00536.1 signal peptidase I [Levilactobacillus bambusae]